MAKTALEQLLKAPSDRTTQMGSDTDQAPSSNSIAYRKIVPAAATTPVTHRKNMLCVCHGLIATDWRPPKVLLSKGD